MHWGDPSLNHKFIAGTAAGLMVSLAVFLLLFVNLYRAELEHERTAAASQVNRLLQTSLENAMLKRDLEGLKVITERLGAQQDILAVMITNPAGEVRFSSQPSLIGGHIPPELPDSPNPSTRFLQYEGGRDVLRSSNPVYNKPPCEECHGPMDQHPINGILYVDYDAASIRERARNTTLLLLGSGSLIVLINLAGGWWFIRRYVIRPVARLATVSDRLSRGDLDARVAPAGRDELGRLGETFNTMAANLQEKIRDLREKEQFLQRLVDAIPDGVRVIDVAYRVVLANAAYKRQLGYDADAETPTACYAAAHGLDAPCPSNLVTCPLEEITRTEKPLRVVHRLQRLDGANLEVEIYAAPMRVNRHGNPELLIVESTRDLEQEVRFSHEQKLSELGRLAAGVAHEIHNPLASVRLALHAAHQANNMEPPDAALVTENLELVDHEIDNCIQVTERLLKLSVSPPHQPELVCVNDVVGETLKLLRWEAETRSVIIDTKFEDLPLRVMATDSELRMLTLNLAQNALHAMPRGGKLAVDCRRVGGRIEMLFDDSGVGMAAEQMAHIFEPFFSRRADGVRGTGLGLSICKTIVDNYGGSLGVESIPGKGSRFAVRFADADAEMET